jgi:hypothetical protein
MARLTDTRAWRALRFLKAELRYRRARRGMRAAPDGARKPALVVLNHYFDNELKVLRNHPGFAGAFEFVLLDPQDVFNKNLWYFPPSVWYAREPYIAPRFEAARARSRAHARRVWDDLVRHHDVAAVVTPSDCFYWVRTFWEEARARGVRTFVFDKEGTISPASMESLPLTIRDHFPPISDRYYVWSERQHEFWLRAGVRDEQIRVLGSLRTDLYVHMPPPERTSVLYFDFELEAYLPTIPPEDRARHPGDWKPFRDELDAALLAKMREYPDVPFTVKCHPQQPDVEERRRTFAGLPNVRVVAGARGVDELVRAHSFCIGFQTTALVEVGLTQRPSVYAGWGPLHEAHRKHLLPIMEPGFGTHWAKSAGELTRLLDAHLREGRNPPPARNDRVKLYFDRPDGHVADRHFEALTRDLGPATGEAPAPSARPRRRSAARPRP